MDRKKVKIRLDAAGAMSSELADSVSPRADLDFSNLFVGGERRFLLACLSKSFNPSIVFVAESHFQLACSFKALKRKGDFLGCATTSAQAIELLRRVSPGIVVVIEACNECIYGDVIDHLSATCPDARSMVIVKSLPILEGTNILRADSVVADKDIFLPVNPMFQALMAIVAGSTYRSPSIISYLKRSDHAVDLPSPDRITLSLRDHQLLEAYALGLSNREVAETLNLSIRTVQTYSGNLLQRLGVNNRQKAIRRAIELGFSVGRKYLVRQLST